METTPENKDGQNEQPTNKGMAIIHFVQSLDKVVCANLRSHIKTIIVFASRSQRIETLCQKVEKTIRKANQRSLMRFFKRIKGRGNRKSIKHLNQNKENIEQSVTERILKQPDLRYAVRVPPSLKHLKNIKVVLKVKNGKHGIKQQQELLRLKELRRIHMFRVLSGPIRSTLFRTFNHLQNYSLTIKNLNSENKQGEKYKSQAKCFERLSELFSLKTRQLFRYGFDMIQVQSRENLQRDIRIEKERLFKWCIHKIANSCLSVQTSIWRLKPALDLHQLS